MLFHRARLDALGGIARHALKCLSIPQLEELDFRAAGPAHLILSFSLDLKK